MLSCLNIHTSDAMVGFDTTIYQLEEGDIMFFCVEVVDATRTNCIVNFPFTITITILPGGSAGNS